MRRYRLSDNIGNTPTIRIKNNIHAKAEIFNPTGSIKDRPASFIINDAEERGILKTGDTIIEATSGNMGVSFAWLAAERGYKCKIVMPSNMSLERKKTLRYYGAELIEVPEGDFDGAISIRDNLSKEMGWFNCNQFHSQLNVESHIKTTGPEILNYLRKNDITPHYFVTGTGTGGTLMGAGTFLKKHFPILKIIAVEPEESPVMSGGSPGIHGIQGIGDGSKFLVDMREVNEVVTVSTEKAKEKSLELSRDYGIFVGISAGANFSVSLEFASEDKNVITFLCDRGDRYYSCL